MTSTAASPAEPQTPGDELRASVLGRRKFGVASGISTLAAMLAVSGWAITTGPEIYRASSDYDLWEHYLRDGRELVLSALAIWLLVTCLAGVVWHRILSRRSAAEGVRAKLTLRSDRYVVLPGLAIGGLMATRLDLSQEIPIAWVVSVPKRELLLNPGGAAAELIAIGWILAYLVMILLELAQRCEGRYSQSGVARRLTPPPE